MDIKTQIPKTIVYYFYIDSDEFYEVYKLHLECLKVYKDIVNKYIIILAINDLNDNILIDIWKTRIQEYLNSDNIEFHIEQNFPQYREGIYYFKYIISNLQNYDGLVLFGHGKRDFLDNKNNIYEWITSCHYILSHDINYIEEKLIYDKYLFFGPHKSQYLIYPNVTIYQGAFYWLNPKKIYNTNKESIDRFIDHINYFLNFVNNLSNIDNFTIEQSKVILMLAENNFILNMNSEYMADYYQNEIIHVMLIETFNNSTMYFQAYSKNEFYTESFLNICDKFYNLDFFDKDDYLNYHNTILNNINGKKEENTN